MLGMAGTYRDSMIRKSLVGTAVTTVFSWYGRYEYIKRTYLLSVTGTAACTIRGDNPSTSSGAWSGTDTRTWRLWDCQNHHRHRRRGDGAAAKPRSRGVA